MTRIYLAMEDELLVIRQQTGDITVERHLVGRHPQCLAVDPERPERVYCGTFDSGVWCSDDAGNSWQPAGQGISYEAVMSVAVSPLDSTGGYGTVYAGTEPSAVFRSTDGGAAWQELSALRELPSAPTWSFPPRPFTHHVRWLLPDPVAAGRLYVCIEAGALIRTADGGRSWQDRVPGVPCDTHTLAAPRHAPGRLYAAAGDGYFESHDGGASWQRPDGGLEHDYCWGVAVDPSDPETIVISAAHGPRQAHDLRTAESAIYRRTGGGQWSQVRAGLPEPSGTTRSVLAANAAEPGAIYAANNHGLFRSSNAGQSWERLDVTWPERYHRQCVQALAVVAG